MREGLGQCGATTAAGDPCRRWASRIDGEYCTDHSPRRAWVLADGAARRERLRELVDLLGSPV